MDAIQPYQGQALEAQGSAGAIRPYVELEVEPPPREEAEVPPGTPAAALQKQKSLRWHSDVAGLATAQATEEDPCGTIELERRAVNDPNMLMNKTWRNFITGEIVLRPELRPYPNFLIVDLWHRPDLPLSVNKLAADPYLFRPVVLPYRTWIYHQGALSHATFNDNLGDDGLLSRTLSQVCIDAPLTGGRTSSLLFFAPLFLATGLTGDDMLMVVTMLVTALVFAIAFACNSVKFYRLDRLISLFLVRLPYLVFVCLRFHTSEVLAVFGYAAPFVACVADFYLGDLAMLTCYRWNCSYEVTKQIPGRIYVVKRQGADHIAIGARVDAKVSGKGVWESRDVLVADIGGILTELRPMTSEDWQEAYTEYHRRGRPLPYVCLGAFGYSWDDVDLDFDPSKNYEWRPSCAASRVSASSRVSQKSSFSNHQGGFAMGPDVVQPLKAARHTSRSADLTVEDF